MEAQVPLWSVLALSVPILAVMLAMLMPMLRSARAAGSLETVVGQLATDVRALTAEVGRLPDLQSQAARLAERLASMESWMETTRARLHHHGNELHGHQAALELLAGGAEPARIAPLLVIRDPSWPPARG